MERELVEEWRKFVEDSLRARAYENVKRATEFIKERAKKDEKMRALAEAIAADSSEEVIKNIEALLN
ncbi:MAG: hypothetical protein QXP36_08830 [Conexivisphaerales archaeon]